MLSFSVGAFALAGLAAAAGPIVAHLMNRRRFKTVDWAAMQFLREAVRQSRRVLHLRDLLLLALRVLCVLLFGLAMARPYFSSTGGTFGAGEPIHAVLLIDNSLSMAYRSTQGTLLDEARTRCRRFVEALPAGSRTTVVPVCSDPADYSLDPAAGKQQALEALDAVAIVDRKAGLEAALGLAEQALARLPDLPNKRVVFVGDGQKINFPADGLGDRFAELGDVQLVALGPTTTDNAWVADVRAVDGAAVQGTETEFAATLRYEGAARRPGVQVGFHIDGRLVETHVVDLEPNSRRLVTFVHRFESAAVAEGPRYAAATVSLSADRLPEDDVRHLVVPIVEPLPILYVSEHGPTSGDAADATGRGLWLQGLLAPVVDRGDTAPKAVRITHVDPTGVSPALLQEARLVVLAGLRTPAPLTSQLRTYVEQGGRLLIVAGEAFDPVAWHDAAWLDGAGILPAPLAPKIVSAAARTPPAPFRFDLKTLGHPLFQLSDAVPDELNDLYSIPVFFDVVAAEPTPESVARLLAEETARIVARREARSRSKSQPPTPEPAATSAAETTVRPAWIEPSVDRDHELKPEEAAARGAPRVIGRFDVGLPFLVERRIDRGVVVFCATALQDTPLTEVRAVVVLDRLLRDLLGGTLPRRNFDTGEPILLPMRPQGSGAYLQLLRPGERSEAVSVDALGEDQYALVLRNLTERGLYRVVARQAEAATTGQVAERVLWELPLAVNGPEQESQLAATTREAAMSGVDAKRVRWLGRDEAIGIDGATVRGRNLWKWLMAAVLACLLVELLLIGRLRPTVRPAPSGGAA